MEKRNQTVIKLAQTALLAALCYVSFTYLQIKIPMPGGDATSIHIGNAFCVLAALLLGGSMADWREPSAWESQTSWIRSISPARPRHFS